MKRLGVYFSELKLLSRGPRVRYEIVDPQRTYENREWANFSAILGRSQICEHNRSSRDIAQRQTLQGSMARNYLSFIVDVDTQRQPDEGVDFVDSKPEQLRKLVSCYRLRCILFVPIHLNCFIQEFN